MVVLTDVAVFDAVAEPRAVRLGPHDIAHSGDPAAPSPPEICTDAVATHTVRHLAWLRDSDEVVATALAAHPDLWHASTATSRPRPGELGASQPLPVR